MNLTRTKLRTEINRELSKSYFWHFCLYYDYAFFSKRPFLKEAAQAMQMIADGEILRLSVSMPPRAGKSYLTSLFCAWMLAYKPEGSVMRNTCTASLYNKFSYDVRDIVRSDRFHLAFPDIELSKDSQAVKGWKTKHSKQMGYFGAGVGGTIIGFGATSVGITDDLYRSIDDALSEVYNEKVHRWKEGSHNSRLERNCPEIDIGTRWTKRDIIGEATESGKYDLSIVIKALDERGESFCDHVKTTAEYQRIKSEIDETIWLAEYQQEPVEAKGILFPAQELQYFEELRQEDVEATFAYCDVADEGDDFLCFVVGKVTSSGKVFVDDLIFTKEGVEVTEPLSLDLLNRNRVEIARIEANNQGGIFANNIRNQIENDSELYSTEILKAKSTQNKHTRILMQSGFIKSKVYFRKNYEIGSDYDKFLTNLSGYLRNGTSKHDDAPDALSGLVKFIKSALPNIYG